MLSRGKLGADIHRAVVVALALSGLADFACGQTPETGQAGSREPTGAAFGTELAASINSLYPGAGGLSPSREPFPHLVVEDSSGHSLGYILDSDSAGTTATGFVGLVPVRVCLDSASRILGVSLLANEETPVYLKLVLATDLMQRLLAYQAGSGDELDAVTCATMTSSAIIEGVVATVDRFALLDSSSQENAEKKQVSSPR